MLHNVKFPTVGCQHHGKHSDQGELQGPHDSEQAPRTCRLPWEQYNAGPGRARALQPHTRQLETPALRHAVQWAALTFPGAASHQRAQARLQAGSLGSDPTGSNDPISLGKFLQHPRPQSLCLENGDKRTYRTGADTPSTKAWLHFNAPDWWL